jgi:hypothetical protein
MEHFEDLSRTESEHEDGAHSALHHEIYQMPQTFTQASFALPRNEMPFAKAASDEGEKQGAAAPTREQLLEGNVPIARAGSPLGWITAGLTNALNSDNARLHNVIAGMIRREGVCALPDLIYFASHNDPKGRCRQLIDEFKNERFPELLNGYTATGAHGPILARAANEVLQEMSRPQIDLAVSRVGPSLSDRQREMLRAAYPDNDKAFIPARLQDLDRQIAAADAGQLTLSERELRESIGFATLFKPEATARLSLALGRQLFEQGADRFPEAVDYIERYMREQASGFAGFGEIGIMRAAQRDVPKWLEVATSLMYRMKNEGSCQHAANLAEMFKAQANQLLDLPKPTEEQRRQIRTMRDFFEQGARMQREHLRRTER